ncbi:MAG: hypothetical protein ACI4I4_02050 [Acutalibacteraceae bacterium]
MFVQSNEKSDGAICTNNLISVSLNFLFFGGRFWARSNERFGKLVWDKCSKQIALMRSADVLLVLQAPNKGKMQRAFIPNYGF